MGQKINPNLFRLVINHNWKSIWYIKNNKFSKLLHEDIKIRNFFKLNFKDPYISCIYIKRLIKIIYIDIYTSKPGLLIGKEGKEVEKLKLKLNKLLKKNIKINIKEIKQPELNAQIVANSITKQLEKRIMFRRAMKMAMKNILNLGALGIKIMSSGRLNGIDIARNEWYYIGRIPLHTLSANIEYAFSEAQTTYGIIGVKVWIYKK